MGRRTRNSCLCKHWRNKWNFEGFLSFLHAAVVKLRRRAFKLCKKMKVDIVPLTVGKCLPKLGYASHVPTLQSPIIDHTCIDLVINLILTP